MEPLMPVGWAGGFGEVLALPEVLDLVEVGAVGVDDSVTAGKCFSTDM